MVFVFTGGKVFRCSNLITALLSIAIAGCGRSATVEMLQTTNVSSKVTAICSEKIIVDVTDVSEDGSVVVGKCGKKQAPNERQVFRYSEKSGAEIIGTKGKEGLDNVHISPDGEVVWGTSYIKNEGSHIFRYTRPEGLVDLGAVGNKVISIFGVSTDGSVIVGHFINSLTDYPLLYHAFRYSQSKGFDDLGAISNESTHARAVSGDGSLIVGNVEFGSNSKSAVRNINSHVFMYSSSIGMQDLGVLGSSDIVFASGISNDGTVIVGNGKFMIGSIVALYENSYFFIYTEKGHMQKLVGIEGEKIRIRVSGDGTKVFGSYFGSKRESFVYTAKLVLQ